MANPPHLFRRGHSFGTHVDHALRQVAGTAHRIRATPRRFS